jgi:hypothetical protein
MKLRPCSMAQLGRVWPHAQREGHRLSRFISNKVVAVSGHRRRAHIACFHEP